MFIRNKNPSNIDISDIWTIDLQKKTFPILNTVGEVIHTIAIPYLHYYAKKVIKFLVGIFAWIIKIQVKFSSLIYVQLISMQKKHFLSLKLELSIRKGYPFGSSPSAISTISITLFSLATETQLKINFE